jgi:uncharacterized membrane-anchored protein
MNRRSTWTRGLTALGALLVLGAVNFAWIGKARIIAEGREVLVALAPVDPRSLMQGDYMALRFEIATEIQQRLSGSEAAASDDPRVAAHEGAFGRAPIRLDEKGVARLDWASDSPQLILRYRLRDRRVWLGTNAFFFEEGEVERYRSARFGVFRLDPDTGEAVLTGLADEAFQRL